MASKDFCACSLTSWYEQFKDVTLKTQTKEVSSDFLDWLRQDGVILPEEVEDSADNDVEWSDCDDGSDSDGGIGGEDEESQTGRPSFPELTDFIRGAISSFGGPVFPKLNWSSPKDAAWVNGGTLKCTHAKDVYTLLKSSDFVMHDIDFALEESCRQGFTFSLILRKWCNLHRSMEFRCFVRDDAIVAACQRDVTQCYPFLKEERQETLELLLDFHQERIKGNFADGKLSEYVFDVYIDRRKRVWLVDFNVYHSTTDSLLFEWPELADFEGSHPEFRILEVEKEVRADPLASYRAPIDAVELASGREFDKFTEQCVKPSKIK